jgi:epoxyqueuosine reductase
VLKKTIYEMILAAGFIRVRFLSPFEPPCGIPNRFRQGAPSLLVTALPYGNQTVPDTVPLASGTVSFIAPFAQRNYYREAVKRLQKLAAAFRRLAPSSRKSDYRILCNSPVPEKPLAAQSGLGALGRNGLIITAEAGSLFVIAAMTLPFALESDCPETDEPFPFCKACVRPACVASCPTGAVRGDGTINRHRCIQWYASGNGETVPDEVAQKWGQTLYGCTICQDACVHNQKPIAGTASDEGLLPAFLDPCQLLVMRDEEIYALFKGTVMGLSWLKPEHIRRNARLAAQGTRCKGGE